MYSNLIFHSEIQHLEEIPDIGVLFFQVLHLVIRTVDDLLHFHILIHHNLQIIHIDGEMVSPVFQHRPFAHLELVFLEIIQDFHFDHAILQRRDLVFERMVDHRGVGEQLFEKLFPAGLEILRLQGRGLCGFLRHGNFRGGWRQRAGLLTGHSRLRVGFRLRRHVGGLDAWCLQHTLNRRDRLYGRRARILECLVRDLRLIGK